MNTQEGNLDTLVQGEIDNDNDFQTSLADLSDEDKSKKTEEKKVEILRKRAEKGIKDDELAKNYKLRAEKAEKALKGEEGDPPPKKDEKTSETQLSSEDIFVLIESKVPKEDIEVVKKASKLLGVSISEALKDPIVKGQLETLAEERKTAGATNKGKHTGATKTPDEVLLDNFHNKDKLPEPGSEEAERLFWLRRGRK